MLPALVASRQCVQTRIACDIKIQQELLRHPTIQRTISIYTQAVSDYKRAANSLVAEILCERMAPEKPICR